jgi:hypothetical protein
MFNLQTPHWLRHPILPGALLSSRCFAAAKFARSSLPADLVVLGKYDAGIEGLQNILPGLIDSSTRCSYLSSWRSPAARHTSAVLAFANESFRAIPSSWSSYRPSSCMSRHLQNLFGALLGPARMPGAYSRVGGVGRVSLFSVLRVPGYLTFNGRPRQRALQLRPRCILHNWT